MWRFIIITTLLLCSFNCNSRPMASVEGPLWADDADLQDLFDKNDPDIFNDNTDWQNVYKTDTDYDVIPAEEKRALAMIARWGPFSNIGKERAPIRSSFIDPNSHINTQTRGRMVGQPLRWG